MLCEDGDQFHENGLECLCIRDLLLRVAVMRFAVDEEGKAMMRARVPEAAINKALDGIAWLREAASAVGGKGSTTHHWQPVAIFILEIKHKISLYLSYNLTSSFGGKQKE